MNVEVLEVVEVEVDEAYEVEAPDVKKSTQSAKLERRRRIEEINEARLHRNEWDEFLN